MVKDASISPGYPIFSQSDPNNVEVALKFVDKAPITKGWSNGQKYQVINDQGKEFLLRVSTPNKFTQKKAEFEAGQLLVLYISSNTLASIPRAIPFGEQQIERFW